MDPSSRTHDPPPSRQSPRRQETPSTSQAGHLSPSVAPYQTQTSLPSIRQLHPYLPPSGITQPLTTGETPSFNPQLPYQSTLSSSFGQVSHRPSLHAVQGGNTFGGAERSPDGDGDRAEQEPPKKKRRRQALSCTECKRRKIRCDRTQPCTPCSRRGEQNKCHWHLVEPIEKYVTRAEHEELKSHFDELNGKFQYLESLVSRMISQSAGATGVPIVPISVKKGPPGLSSPLPAEAHPGSIAYPALASPTHYAESSHPLGRYARSGGMLPPSPRQQHSFSTAPIIIPSQASTAPALLSRPRPHLRSPVMHSNVESSALALGSIASPFTPANQEGQPKNFRAQTLMLGERLRTVPLVPESPAIRTPNPLECGRSMDHRTKDQHRQARQLRPSFTRRLDRQRCVKDRCHRNDSAKLRWQRALHLRRGKEKVAKVVNCKEILDGLVE